MPGLSSFFLFFYSFWGNIEGAGLLFSFLFFSSFILKLLFHTEGFFLGCHRFFLLFILS